MKYINTEQAAALLNVSEQTIYHYIRDEKLNPINKEKWQVEGTYLFNQDEVEGLRIQVEKPGMTTGDVARALGETTANINQRIKKGIIPAEKYFYKGKDQYFISPEDFEAYKASIPTVFYSKKLNFGLFQPFNSYAGEFGRITFLTKTDGILTTEKDREIPLNELSNEGFKPLYEIKQHERDVKKGDIKLQAPLPSQIKAPFYSMVDFLYRNVGPINMTITQKDHTITVEFKSLYIDLTPNNEEIIHMLKRHIVEGRFFERENALYIQSELEGTMIYLPYQLKEKIKKTAKQHERNLEEEIISILESHMNNKGSEV